MAGAAVRCVGCVWNGRRGNSQVAASNGGDGNQVGSGSPGVVVGLVDGCRWNHLSINVTEYSGW